MQCKAMQSKVKKSKGKIEFGGIETMRRYESKKKNCPVRRAKGRICIYPEVEKHVRECYANRIRDGDAKKYYGKEKRKTGL